MTTAVQAAPQTRVGFATALVPVWLTTALWDFVCASALSVFAYHTSISRLWRGVAAVLLGPTALQGGSSAVVVGIALHFAVALTWSSIFVFAALHWPALRRWLRNPATALGVAAIYGPIIWLVMSLVVIPLGLHRMPTFGARWWVQVFAHLPFVTLPLVFAARAVIPRD